MTVTHNHIDRAIAPAPQGGHIVVRHLTKRYGALTVFEDINLEIREREIVSLVGPSGCGKTTLLRCIDGLTPAEGEVTLDGVRITDPPAHMAMVFQHFGLFPWKTVYDNVAYGLRMSGASSAEIAKRVPILSISSVSPVSRRRFPIRCPAGCSSVAGSRARLPSDRVCC
jgi:NitT/TauT family transport system ATP-binding protein